MQFTHVKEVNYSDQPFSFNLILRPFQSTSVLLTISRKDRLHHAISTFDETDNRNILTPRYNIMHFHVVNSHCPFLIIDRRRRTAQLFINEIILRRIAIPFNYIILIEIHIFLQFPFILFHAQIVPSVNESVPIGYYIFFIQNYYKTIPERATSA